MNTYQDIGPAADQNNIPIAGATVNDIAITYPGGANARLLLGFVRFTGQTANTDFELRIYKNAAFLPGPAVCRVASPNAAEQYQAVVMAHDPTETPGAVYTLYALSEDGTADILTNRAMLILVTG